MCRTGENIHKRKDGRWEGRTQIIDDAGKKKIKSLYGKSYREVKQKIILYRQDINNNTCVSYTNHSLEEVSKEWLLLQSTNHKESTVLKYKTIIESQILPYFGSICVKEISEIQITEFIASKQKNGNLKTKEPLSSSYIKLILIVVTSILNYAAGMGYRTEINKKYICKPNHKCNKTKCLDKESQEKLYRYLKNNTDKTSVGVSLGLLAGLRIGEVCALQWNDIDLCEGVISVNHTVSRVSNSDEMPTKTKLIISNPKTNSSRRSVPLVKELADILNSVKDTSGYVVSSGKSFISPRTFDYRFHSLLKKLDIEDINFHALRHTFATKCVESGIDAKTISELLGHASVDITFNTYVHTSLERKKEEIIKLSF